MHNVKSVYHKIITRRVVKSLFSKSANQKSGISPLGASFSRRRDHRDLSSSDQVPVSFSCQPIKNIPQHARVLCQVLPQWKAAQFPLQVLQQTTLCATTPILTKCFNKQTNIKNMYSGTNYIDRKKCHYPIGEKPMTDRHGKALQAKN